MATHEVLCQHYFAFRNVHGEFSGDTLMPSVLHVCLVLPLSCLPIIVFLLFGSSFYVWWRLSLKTVTVGPRSNCASRCM